MSKRVKRIGLAKPVQSISAARSVLKESGDAVLVVRGKLRNFVMICPCGCTELLIINLDPTAGKAWKCFNKKSGLSLYPSIWRTSGCRSHFIISRNEIWWCDYDEEWIDWSPDAELGEKVVAQLSPSRFQHYEEVAIPLDEDPWEVLVICRRLVQMSQVEESSDERGWFRLRPISATGVSEGPSQPR